MWRKHPVAKSSLWKALFCHTKDFSYLPESVSCLDIFWASVCSPPLEWIEVNGNKAGLC